MIIIIIKVTTSHIIRKDSLVTLLHEKYFFMSAIFVLIGISLFVAISFLIAFMWAVKNGQYDDEDAPARRMLFDDTLDNKTNK
jgi:cbb3-type cytochrome oxidase maturation protein